MWTKTEATAAKLLKKLEFPIDNKEIMEYVNDNKKDAEYPEALINVLRRIPDRSYDSIHDIEREIGKVK
jgi:hypothetical protein